MSKRKKPRKTVLQPDELLKMAGIRDIDEGIKVMGLTLDFLVWLNVGDELRTSTLKFTRIDERLFSLDVGISSESLANELEKKKIVKLVV